MENEVSFNSPDLIDPIQPAPSSNSPLLVLSNTIDNSKKSRPTFPTQNYPAEDDETDSSEDDSDEELWEFWEQQGRAELEVETKSVTRPENSEQVTIDGEKIVSIDALIPKVDDSEKRKSHLRYYGPRQTFSIADDRYSDFWQVYCQLASDELTNQVLTIGEMSIGETVPFVTDIRLEFNNPNLNLGDNLSFVYSMIYTHQRAINKLIIPSPNHQELVVILLESKRFEIEENKIGYYYRLHFPYCRITQSILEKNLYPMVRKNFAECLQRLPIEPLGSIETIVTSPFFDNSLPLYHSRPRANYPLMLYSGIYSEIDNSCVEEPDVYDIQEDLNTLCPLEIHSHIIRGLVDIDKFPDGYEDEHWLPFILSLEYYTIQSTVNSNIINSPHRQTLRNGTQQTNYNRRVEEPKDDDPIIIAQKLLLIVSPKRFSTDYSWKAIGEAIFNITKGSEDGLKWWIRQSLMGKGEKFKAKDCRKFWYIWNNSPDPVYCTVKTIAYYARMDNPEKYAEWHKSWYSETLTRATSLTETDIATSLYRINWLDYCCASLSSKSWYKFGGDRWEKMDKAADLRKNISKDFVKRFEEMRTEISRKIEQTGDDNSLSSANKQTLEALSIKINELIQRLKKTNHKNSIVTEAQEHFYDRFFEKYADSNVNLMGVKNGVIETTDTRAVFRPGKPEDYLIKYSEVRYNPYLNWKHEEVGFMMRWAKKTFQDDSLIRNFFFINSSCLRSGNSDKLFVVWSGELGNNSKSAWKKAVDTVFGDYSIDLPDSILTEKPRASGPSPELAQANKAKIAWVVEPDEDDAIRNSILKKLTGGDPIFARYCNDNGGKFPMTFTLFMMCNKIPIIPKSEKAVINRLHALPFESIWSRKAPKNVDDQHKLRHYPEDIKFDEKIKIHSSALLWILVEMYAKYMKHGLKISKASKKYTNDYWESTNLYSLFQQDQIDIDILPNSVSEEHPNGVVNEKVAMNVSDVYNMFVTWFQNNMHGIPVPLRPTVVRELSHRWGEPHDNMWRGIKAKQRHHQMAGNMMGKVFKQ